MRKNGFTLIELLAVIVILAIIALIATPIILGIINDAREKANERSVELYAAAVKNGIAAYQLVEGKEIKPDTYTKETLPFTVDYDGDVECTSIIISDDSKVSLSGCKVNGGEKQYNYGIIEEEETPSLAGTMGICNPLNVQTEGTYTAGDKYECDVDPNKEGYDYIFYVLNADATSVNLIMDANIRTGGEPVKEASPTEEQKGLVAWLSDESYAELGGKVTDEMLNDDGPCQYGNICVLNSYGPITAMNYLQTATASWTNTKELTINKFTDHTGATHNMTEYVVNARMPYYSEVSEYSESTAYLYDYLENYGYQTNKVSGVYGYWTLSSAYEEYDSWFVLCQGVVASSGGLDFYNTTFYIDNVTLGVRPVINLSI